MEGLPESAWIFAGSVIAALIVLFSGWLKQKISVHLLFRDIARSGLKIFGKHFQSTWVNSKSYPTQHPKTQSPAAPWCALNCFREYRPVREARNYLRLYTNPG